MINIFEYHCHNFGDFFELILVSKTFYNILAKSLFVWRHLKVLLEKKFPKLRKIKENQILDFEELKNLVQKFFFKEKLTSIDLFLKKAGKLFDYNSTRVSD